LDVAADEVRPNFLGYSTGNEPKSRIADVKIQNSTDPSGNQTPHLGGRNLSSATTMRLRAILLCSCFAVVFGSAAADEVVCPEGAELKGETTPEVRENWCELIHNGSAVHHGPYRAWYPNGVLGTSGQLTLGKPVGEWKAWFPSGKLLSDEWYEDGRLVRARYWNEEGQEVAEPVSLNESESDE